MSIISPQILFLAVASISSLVLGIWVYFNNPKSATNQIFGILGFFVSVWVIAMYLAQAPQFIDSALLITRLTIFFAAPMNALFFLLAYTIPENSLKIGKRWLAALLTATLLIMVLALTPYVFQRVDVVNGFPNPVPGPALALFGLVSIAENIGAVYILARRLRHAQGSIKEQLRFVMLGIMLMFGAIVAAIFLPVLLFGNATLVPLAPAFTIVFLAMTAYAVIYHRLLDVRLIVARTISFIAANFILAFVYGLVVYLLLTGLPLVLQSSALYTVDVLILAASLLSFGYVEKTVANLTNKIFFRREYDPEVLFDQLTRLMVDTLDLNILTHNILKKLIDEMNIMKGVFIVFDNHKISDVEGIGYSADQIKAVNFDALFHYQEGIPHLVFEDIAESPLKELFRKIDISFALPISVDNKDVAILLLGKKLSGDVYFNRDIQFLELFAREAGIAIQNARSYNEIKLFNKELESRVEARTKDLEESQEREREKAKSVAKLKDEFFFVAAHELRAPITAIRGFLELVSESNKKIPKDLEENLGEIHYASDHLNQLVNDLLEIARSEADAMKINVEAVDLDALVDEIIKELGPMAKKAKVKLRNGTFFALKALADKSKVKEVFTNIISNRIKYNREGGLVFIQIVSVPDTDRVFVEIRDTGFGIPIEEQSKIFGKFFRATNENTNKVLGTGLGLFLTRMLVQKMGGDISFTSIPGEGTTFSFYLTKAPDEVKVEEVKKEA